MGNAAHTMNRLQVTSKSNCEHTRAVPTHGGVRRGAGGERRQRQASFLYKTALPSASFNR